jgi:prepilin-type processing-associated H-X9-DG protein
MKMKQESLWQRAFGLRDAGGFTRIELLAVIVSLGLLAGLPILALSQAKPKAREASCLGSGMQVILAMLMYTADNHGYFPPNPDDGNTVPGYNWCAGSAGPGDPEEFNPDIIRDPKRSLLIKYLGGNAEVFRCAADQRRGVYQGTDPALAGKTVPAARTISMNQAVGTIDPGYDARNAGHSGVPTLAVNAPWLSQGHANRHNSPWSTYAKASSIGSPGPAMLWLVVEESTESLNDAAFAFCMETPNWVDAPGSYHDGGCFFSFADGHVELRQWSERPQPFSAAPTNDLAWMRPRTSAPAPKPSDRPR